MAEMYFIFESNVTGELFAVLEWTERDARDILANEVGETDLRLWREFVADAWGDLYIDSLGLDVF